jgi:hypothetical protein
MLTLYALAYLPRDASLSFVLSLLVDHRRKTGITLEQGPSFYLDLESHLDRKSNGERPEINPLGLEKHIFQINEDEDEISLSVLIDNFGILSVRGQDGRHHGITLSPMRDKSQSEYEIVLKGEMIGRVKT